MCILRTASFIETLLKAKKPNRVVYKKLITVKQQRPAQSQDKWVLDCQLKTCEDVDWKSVYQAPFKYIKVTKLITFQFKLFHRWLATNDFLKKIGLKQSDICTFCETEIERYNSFILVLQCNLLFLERF